MEKEFPSPMIIQCIRGGTCKVLRLFSNATVRVLPWKRVRAIKISFSTSLMSKFG